MSKNRELQSRRVLESSLNEDEKEIIKLFVNGAVKASINKNNSWKYYEGFQDGIAQTLRLLDRKDIWDLIDYEFPYHDELN